MFAQLYIISFKVVKGCGYNNINRKKNEKFIKEEKN